MLASVCNFARKLQEPIVTNRGLDLLAVYLWAWLAWWGATSSFAGIPTVSMAATPLYEFVWGVSIGVLSLVAMLAAASTFIQIKNVSRAMKRWTEMVALLILTPLMSVYPALLISSAFGGDDAKLATIGVGMFILGFPAWRITHTFCRIRALAIAGDSDTDG